MAKKARCRGKGMGTLLLRGKTWFARWKVNGKVYTRTTGEADKREAEKRLAEYTAPFRLGSDIEALEAVAVKIDGRKAEIEQWHDGQPAMTLLQAWQAFKESPKGKTARGRVIMPGVRTLADYEGRWSAFCDWMEKHYPKKDADGNRIPWELRQIEPEHAQRYIAEVETTRSGNTRNKTLTLLRLMFNVLAEVARVKANPFDEMEAAKLAVSRKRALTAEELALLSKRLEGAGEMEVLFSLGYYTGARLADCALMKWDSIDMGGRKIRFTPRKTAKSNDQITLAIPPALYTLLSRTPKNQRRGYVLPKIGPQYETRSGVAIISRRVQKVFTDAGIETALKVNGYSRSVARVGFHSLRHAHITALLENGIPMEEVRLRAGHITIGMTAHYFHASDNTLANMSAALPEIGHGNTKALPADATRAILDQLAGWTASELQGLVAKVQAMIGKPEKAEVVE